jgi:hypothetical protein
MAPMAMCKTARIRVHRKGQGFDASVVVMPPGLSLQSRGGTMSTCRLQSYFPRALWKRAAA